MTYPTPVLLENIIQTYDWGSTESIAQIQGRSESPVPEAELWIGVHPAGPSRLRNGSNSSGISLTELLAQQGPQWLGSSRDRFGDTLPFLLKILAAAKPLSLQVHPDQQRAKRVFTQNPNGPYVDANHKPEILCALTPFSALHGFRDFDSISRNLSAIPDPKSRVARAISQFSGAASESGLRQLVATLVSLTQPEIEQLCASLEQLTLRESALNSATVRAIRQLLEHYPADGLVIAPLLFNVVQLEPGDAIFTGPGVIHSYLEGTGVELMANSDNVVRVGLTSKKTDATELLKVSRFEPQPSELTATRRNPRSPFTSFVTPAPEFELGRLEWQQKTTADEPRPDQIQILLATSGQFEITTNGTQLPLYSGESLLVPALQHGYRIQGHGTLFRATVGSDSA